MPGEAARRARRRRRPRPVRTARSRPRAGRPRARSSDPPLERMISGSGRPAAAASSGEALRGSRAAAATGRRRSPWSRCARTRGTRSRARARPTRARPAARPATAARDAALVLGMRVGVQQADRDGLDLRVAQAADGVLEPALRRARARTPSGSQRSATGRRSSAGTSGAGPRAARAVQLRPRLARELEHVGEALGGQQRRARAALLEQGVRGDGHAVTEARHVAAARSRRARAPMRTAAITPSDWSAGVVGTLPVKTPAGPASTASVNVPPTSTPSDQLVRRCRRRRSRRRESNGTP